MLVRQSALPLEPLCKPFFGVGYFQDGVSRTIVWAGLKP
jgi:hypothetical protein